jgi:hypothetical protein
VNESTIPSEPSHGLDPNQHNEVAPARFFNRKRVLFWVGSLLVIFGVIALALPATRTSREGQRREVCEQNLQGLAQAALSFSEASEP